MGHYDTAEQLTKRFRNGRIVCERHERNIKTRIKLYKEMRKIYEQHLIMKRLSE